MERRRRSKNDNGLRTRSGEELFDRPAAGGDLALPNHDDERDDDDADDGADDLGCTIVTFARCLVIYFYYFDLFLALPGRQRAKQKILGRQDCAKRMFSGSNFFGQLAFNTRRSM